MTPTKSLAFQGAYTSTTNYCLNDVVTWQSTAWISTEASNHGNTPDFSPYAWAVLVPAGSTGLPGATGATGPAGIQGPQGERGVTGDTGLQGERGLTGATGRPGFVYQGAYASTTNYAAGDVVLWQGSSYSSLLDSNHGNTPDQSAAAWGLLTSTGPQGATGATGATGPQGDRGVPGEFGPAGPQGLTGQVGSTGPQGQPGRDGAQGPQGDRGPVGSTGAPGPVGLRFRGGYDSGTNYAQNDAVTWQNQTWLSLVNSNVGQTPSESPLYWTLLAAQGATGAQGPVGLTGQQGQQGVTGVQGAQGSTGVTGATGPQGEPGSTFEGGYDAARNYAVRDAVSFGGGTWLSLTAGNHGNTPGTTADWAQLAAPGATGPQGLAGNTGPAGAPGNAGPQGSAGPAGPAGATGPQGQPVAFRGVWNGTSAYVTGDAVSYNGSSFIATSAISGTPPGTAGQWSLLARQGDAGGAGPAGAPGAAGAAGQTGAPGATGATGAPGLNWLGTYNATTNYGLRDAVSYNGSSYMSLVANNAGNTPGASGSTEWSVLAAAGATGAQGIAGANGSNGAAATIVVGAVNTGAPGTGATVQNVGTPSAAQFVFTIPQGASGATGAAGVPGLVYRGTWMSGSGYAANDVVYAGGNWSLLAAQGAPGAATVQIGTVTAGSTASVTNSGTQNAATLNFVLPQGATGPTGATGLTWRGPWSTTTSYAANDAVSYGGSAYIATANSQGTAPVGSSYSGAAWALLAAQGAAGPAGTTGPTGATPAFTINLTITGQPGSNAAVVLGGTAANPTLTFTVPQGATGATGSGGSGGSGGAVFTTVHTVQGTASGAGSYFYPVGSTLSFSTEIPGALTLLPPSCNVASINLYNTSSTAATVVLRASSTISSLGPVLTCSAAGGASTCTANAGVNLGAKLVDFTITPGASATSSIFTEFTCQ